MSGKIFQGGKTGKTQSRVYYQYMNPNPGPPRYSLGEFQQYISLIEKYSGSPTEIALTKEAMTWYKQMVQQMAKTFHLNPTTNKTKFGSIDILEKP